MTYNINPESMGNALEAKSTFDLQGGMKSFVDEARGSAPKQKPRKLHGENDLPIWGLPEDILQVVMDVEQGYQTNRDFALASMYAAAAALLGKRVWCKFLNHINHAELWILIVAESTENKTAPMKFFFKPIREAERKAHAEYSKALSVWEATESKVRGERPQYKRRVVGNASDEAMIKALAVNGSICWACNEFDTAFRGFGQYKKGSGNIVGHLIDAFDYEDIPVDRVSSEPLYISEPSLCMAGTIQPETLFDDMSGRGYIGNGFFQRFLYVFPDSQGTPPFKADLPDVSEARVIWARYVERLTHETGEVTETDEAFEVHAKAIERWRGMCESDYKGITGMVALVRKMEIHLCRWAIVTALLRGSHIITDADMRYSVKCMDYFIRSGKKAYDLVSDGRTEKKPLTVEELIRELFRRKPELRKNQSAFARLAGVSHQYINRICNELKIPDNDGDTEREETNT